MHMLAKCCQQAAADKQSHHADCKFAFFCVSVTLLAGSWKCWLLWNNDFFFQINDKLKKLHTK